ncbi:MAG: hypothetical protein AAF752_09535 [Bacteroidota bacterium]
MSGAAYALGPYFAVRERAGALLEEQPRAVSEAREWLDAIGPEGRDAYATFQWIDLGTAALTALAMFVALAFVLSRLTSWPGRRVRIAAATLPLFVFVAEVTENILLTTALARYPDVAESALAAVEMVTSVKLPVGFLTFALTATGLIAVAAHALWQRRQAHKV